MVERTAREVATSRSILDRMCRVSESKNDSELAKLLEISPQAVSKARRQGKIPKSWITSIAEKTGVDIAWLQEGDKQDMEAVKGLPTIPQVISLDSVAEYHEIKKELELERKERRILATENRKLVDENRQLWKENGQLREKVARLEEAAHKPGILNESAASTGAA